MSCGVLCCFALTVIPSVKQPSVEVLCCIVLCCYFLL
nr:MAG TPA: hypothetical protein [Caudoviricetes sp.]